VWGGESENKRFRFYVINGLHNFSFILTLNFFFPIGNGKSVAKFNVNFATDYPLLKSVANIKKIIYV